MQTTIKLHEATKQFEISNKLAMYFLERQNLPVKSHSSVITIDQLELLRDFAANQGRFPDIIDEFNRLEREKQEKTKGPLPQEEDKPEPVEVRPERIEKPGEKRKEEIPRPSQPPRAQEPRPEQRPPEQKRPEERRPEQRQRPPDQRRPEQRPPDQRRPDQRRPEQRPPDQRRPEQRRPDQRPPDQRRPEQRRPEQRPPDQRRPEQRPPEQRRPEQRPPEQRPPDERRPEQRPPEERRPVQERHDRAGQPVVAEKLPVDRQRPAKPGTPHRAPEKPPEARPPREERKPVEQRKPAAPVKPAEPRREVRPPQETRPPHAPHDNRGNRGGRDYRSQGTDRAGREGRFSRDRRDSLRAEVKKPPKIETVKLPEMIQISAFATLKELAEKLNVKLRYVDEQLKQARKEFIPNQMLGGDDIKDICALFNVMVEIIPFEDDIFFTQLEKQKPVLSPRPPVVTVMGHVDHGKTTLLDTLRNTQVADKEAGGITQKIGAYWLHRPNQDIIFLDTPGHEAFTNIRSRGASVTDIVILVVAADDGVKPQTIEAINHAQAAKVPIIVAINKIDMPGADPNKVKQELSRHNIVVEDWGGDVVAVEISAKLNKNLDSLLEMVGLVADMLELKAYRGIPARGTIIESRLDPQLGPLATVLIQHGTINRGDYFICGNSVGKVKSMFDDTGKVLDNADVPMPVEIMGFEDIPQAGERFQVTDDLEKARKVIEMRKIQGKEARSDEIDAEKKLSLQSLFEKFRENKTRVFPIIIKSDNFSSGEVLENILLKQAHEKLKINIVHLGIGNITESDVLLASTTGAIIIGFNVKLPQKIECLAKREKIEIKLYNIIYHLIEDMEKAIKGEIEPEYVESRIGLIEVQQKFKISRVGIIAGCIVKEGKVTGKSRIKVTRNNEIVFEGEIETLKRIKNDASEVNAGTECGIKVKNFNDIEVGDILEAYEVKIKE